MSDIRGVHSTGHRLNRMMVARLQYFQGNVEGEYEATDTSDDLDWKLEFEVNDNDSGWLHIGPVELTTRLIEISIVSMSRTEGLVFDAVRSVQMSED